MDFFELHKDTDCDCIASATQNCSDTFSRKVSEGVKGLKDRYFRISKQHRDAPFVNCENHCSTKSISIDLWNDESQEHIKRIQSESISFELAPSFRGELLIFKIKQYGGLVKHSPVTGNDYHHDYYQPDNFSAPECLEYINTIKLTPNDV